MVYRVVFSGAAFRELVARLAAGPNRREIFHAGVSQLTDHTEFLVHRFASPGADTPPTSATVIVRSVARPDGFAAALYQEPAMESGVVLALGIGAAGGRLAGLLFMNREGSPLDQVAIIESGMPSIHLAQPAVWRDGEPAIWSRTIGALGEDTWRRLTSLRFAVVGCGRSGQLIATSLARIGVQHLTLIDPDRLELHNVGEGDGVFSSDIGKSKVEALRGFLERNRPAPGVTGVAESIFSLSPLVAIKASDFVICSVDSASARIATDFLAKLYLKPLADVGTGILRQIGSRRMGIDVRLVLPGRCLICYGGVAGLAEARAQILSGSAPPLRDWREQRMGSLRSLNQLAVGHALRLIEEFMQGHLRGSAWLQMEIQESGLPALEHRVPPDPANCRFCNVTGLGDDGVHLLPSTLE